MARKTVASILENAKALVKKGWTRGCFARDKDGNSCPIKSKSAITFCMSGALTKASGSVKYETIAHKKAYNLLETVTCCGHRQVCTWNDDAKGKADVLRAFTRAINLAKKTAK